MVSTRASAAPAAAPAAVPAVAAAAPAVGPAAAVPNVAPAAVPAPVVPPAVAPAVPAAVPAVAPAVAPPQPILLPPEAEALRQALVRLGFSDLAAVSIVDEFGIDIERLARYKDTDVETLCKVVRRPGGMIANNPAAVALGGPPQVPDAGLKVSPAAEDNLKLACYFLRYRKRTSRPLLADDIELDAIYALEELRGYEKDHDAAVDPPTIDTRDWPRTIESLEEYFRSVLGETSKIPLAYVIREEEDPAPSADDPPTNYDSRQEELIARAPMRGPDGRFTETYLGDRAKVWELLAGVCRNQECWTYVKPGMRARDGRLAFLGLKDHYMGSSFVDNMSAAAEKKLNTATYTGESRRWTFEQYVTLHKKQHQILEGLRAYGYVGIDERTKVRLLMDGINSSLLDSVKNTIFATEALRSDFDACVNLFKDAIAHSQSARGGKNAIRDANVSGLGSQRDATDGGKKAADNVKPDMSVEDRYYKVSEYRQLTRAQKLGLQLKRKSRGGSGKDKDKRKPKKVKFDKRTIKALASELRKDRTESDTQSVSSESSSDTPKQSNAKKTKSSSSSNRTNPALQRK